MRGLAWSAAALLAAAAAVPAAAQGLSPADIVNRHMAAAAKGDIAALMADYADNAVTIVGPQVTQGKPAITKMFSGLFGPAPAGAPPRPPMQVARVWQEGEVGLVSWSQGPRTGTDAFLVRGGKILVQAVFIGGPPPGGPGAPPPLPPGAPPPPPPPR